MGNALREEELAELNALRDAEGSQPPLICSDPNPKRCDAYTDEVLSAADYWDTSKTPQPISWSSLLAPISFEVRGMRVQAMTSLLVCSGIAFAAHRRPRGVLTSGARPFL